MLNAKQTMEAFRIMQEMFPNAKTTLDAGSDYHFLIAVILSAQATDKSVNKISGPLFKRFPLPKDMATVAPEDVAPYIKTIGLYKNKSRFLVKCSQQLVENFDGQVPRTRKELMTLAGVGRKTANVVLSDRFGIPAFGVDTHVGRVAKRLDIVPQEANVLQIERELEQRIPPDQWLKAHHTFLVWGRYQCTARSPKCSSCPLLKMCAYGQKNAK